MSMLYRNVVTVTGMTVTAVTNLILLPHCAIMIAPIITQYYRLMTKQNLICKHKIQTPLTRKNVYSVLLMVTLTAVTPQIRVQD